MTDICDSSSGDECWTRERDAPAIVTMPPIWRLLRALSNLWRRRKADHALRLHRMNDYMLRDIGLTRMDYEDPEAESLHPLRLPFARRDDQAR